MIMMSRRSLPSATAAVLLTLLCLPAIFVAAFLPTHYANPHGNAFVTRQYPSWLASSTTTTTHRLAAAANDHAASEPLRRVSQEMEDVPIPYIDKAQNSFIDCYIDSIANIDGVEYSIGVPCDYVVALCYYDENDQLVPIELDDERMDDVFPVAERIVTEEFGEELVLQRTPQTLTLVGELEEEEEEDDNDMSDDDEDETPDGEEEVEVLLSFDHRDIEYNLVKLMDPILIVGKVDDSMPDNRVLLSPEESDAVMPELERLFLEYHDDLDSVV